VTATVTIPRIALAQTPQAVKLYAILVHHLGRGFQPSRENLAETMRFNRVKSVDGYIAELEAAGLITVTRPGGKAPNTYALTEA
jgi:hypothetical protein